MTDNDNTRIRGLNRPDVRGRLPVNTRFYYGWLIVVIAGVGIFFSGPGQTYTNSVFIDFYMRDLGLSQTVVSSIYSGATLLSGLLMVFMGRMVDRWGWRIMLTIAGFMLGSACFFNSFVTGPVMLFAGFFLVRYFGQGSLMLIPNTLVSQWFFAWRGRALSFAGIGGLASAAAFPPLINWLIGQYGWQSTWRILGVALIVFFVPLAFWLVRDRPEDVGLLPDGRRAVPETPERAGAPEPAAEHSWTLREAVRTRAFWCVMICGAVMAMVLTGITFQLFPILAERGIDRTTTAFMLSLVPVISFVCSLIAGFVVERVRAHLVLGLAFLLCAATPVMLMHAGSMAAVILFAATWGIAQGFMNIPLGVLWPNYFGRRHLAGIQGVTHTAMVIGSALGPVQFGWAFDRFGSYDSVLLASAGIWVLGAALAFLATPPVRRMEKDAA